MLKACAPSHVFHRPLELSQNSPKGQELNIGRAQGLNLGELGVTGLTLAGGGELGGGAQA